MHQHPGSHRSCEIAGVGHQRNLNIQVPGEYDHHVLAAESMAGFAVPAVVVVAAQFARPYFRQIRRWRWQLLRPTSLAMAVPLRGITHWAHHLNHGRYPLDHSLSLLPLSNSIVQNIVHQKNTKTVVIRMILIVATCTSHILSNQFSSKCKE